MLKDKKIKFRSGASQQSSSKVETIIYPNPARDYLMINLDVKAYPMDIQFVDLNGKTVITKVINNHLMDVSKLSSGIYHYRIITATDKIHIGKIIIDNK